MPEDKDQEEVQPEAAPEETTPEEEVPETLGVNVNEEAPTDDKVL